MYVASYYSYIYIHTHIYIYIYICYSYIHSFAFWHIDNSAVCALIEMALAQI